MDRDKLEKQAYLMHFIEAAEAYEFLDKENFDKKLTFEHHVSKFMDASDAFLTEQIIERYKKIPENTFVGSGLDAAIWEGLHQDGYKYNQENSKRYKTMPFNKHNKNYISSQKCYILKDKSNDTYKIGCSKDPLRREKTLQSEKPDLELIKVFEKNHEKELHKKYAEQCVRGEWFKLTPVQVKYICTHYK